MAYLRLVRSAPAAAAPDHPCVAAFDRELDYVFATLRRLGAKPMEVEDLAQELFLVLLKRWPAIDTTRPMRPYLFAIAFRLCQAQRRRRRREIPVESIDQVDDVVDPEAEVQRRDEANLLRAALEHVPLPRRAVIVMHELDDVPILEVARRLSMSQFGTYGRLRKGRRELLAALRRLSRIGKRKLGDQNGTAGPVLGRVIPALAK